MKKSSQFSVNPYFLWLLLLSILSCNQNDLTNPVEKQPTDLIHKAIIQLDSIIPTIIASQIIDPNHKYYGGIPDKFDIPHPAGPVGLILNTAAVYSQRQSKYYHDSTLLDRLNSGAQFILKRQHQDGTIDLLTTNFHSTPDVAFMTEPVSIAYELLVQDNFHNSIPARDSLKKILLQAGKALSVGGIHTPNHRWVVCMALARIHHLFPNPDYLDRINQWVQEGIDIDADGQYNERSTAVYSPITNKSLITVAMLTEHKELFSPVRKNLDMTQYLVHPDGTLVTEISRRQDQYTIAPSANYIYPYWKMGLLDQNQEYLSTAAWLLQKYPEQVAGFTPYFMIDSQFTLFDAKPYILEVYDTFFPANRLYRWRKNMTDVSVLGNNSILFTMQNHDLKINAIRCATAFFGKGQFIGDTMYKKENTYLIQQKLQGPYFQPLAQHLLPKDGDWEKMPKTQRPISENQNIFYTMTYTRNNNKHLLDFILEGTEHVPVSIEINFDDETVIDSSQILSAPDIENAYLFRSNELKIKSGKHLIQIVGGKTEHKWTTLRGALPKLKGKSVYITGFTPFTRQLVIEYQ